METLKKLSTLNPLLISLTNDRFSKFSAGQKLEIMNSSLNPLNYKLFPRQTEYL